MEEAQSRHRLADPRKDDLDHEEQREEAVSAEAPSANPRRDADDEEDQTGENHEVPEPDMEAKAVVEGVLVDGAAVVHLVRGEERAVPGQADLDDDHEEEQSRPAAIQSVEHETSR